MKTIAIALLSAAVALGVYIGTLYLRGDRRKSVIVNMHLLAGALGVETMIPPLVRFMPGRAILSGGPIAAAAAVLLIAALLSGALGPLLRRNSPMIGDIILATHVAVAAAGFVLFLVWATDS